MDKSRTHPWTNDCEMPPGPSALVGRIAHLHRALESRPNSLEFARMLFRLKAPNEVGVPLLERLAVERAGQFEKASRVVRQELPARLASFVHHLKSCKSILRRTLMTTKKNQSQCLLLSL